MEVHKGGRLCGIARRREIVRIGPTMEDENVWEAGEIINSVIEKHFKHTMTMEKREAIIKNFP